MKTCLVLEGGAMRGMYTAGVLDVFYRAGIHFDGIIGVSAGAAFGVNYLSRQPGRVIRYNKRFNIVVQSTSGNPSWDLKKSCEQLQQYKLKAIHEIRRNRKS